LSLTFFFACDTLSFVVNTTKLTWCLATC